MSRGFIGRQELVLLKASRLHYNVEWLDSQCAGLGFTGIDGAYEAPSHPDLTLKAGQLTLEECVERVVTLLKDKVWLWLHTHQKHF